MDNRNLGKSICVFGDSIVWGASDEEMGGWVERLRTLFLRGNDIEVYNLGISGNNTEKLIKRFEDEAKYRGADILIFSIGTNDSQYIESKNNPRVSLKKFKKNIEYLIKKSRKITNKIIFIGLIKVDESKTMPVPWSDEKKYYDNENILKYNSVISEVCLEKNVYFLDIYNFLNNDDLDDGLHPNSNGHNKIFEKVRDYLNEKGIL